MSDLDDFKNFHRNLCDRFGYHHDPVDWKRDQVSLEEHIAGRMNELRAEKAALATQIAVMRDEEAQRVKIKALEVLWDKNRIEDERKSREAMQSIGISTHWSYTAGKTTGAMTLELVELVKKLMAETGAKP